MASESSDANSIVLERMGKILANVSQAEIARKTKTSRNNVSRYFSGRRMPIDFCQGVIEAFDINPTWLFTGQGKPRISDHTEEVGKTASDLLELVNAMNAVMKMRVGSLVGKDHLKVLRQLNDAIENYEIIRSRINEYFKPIFSDLVEKFGKSLQEKKIERAEGYRVAARQVARLCDDEDGLIHLHSLESTLETYNGDPNKALFHARRVFWAMITSPEEKSKHVFYGTANNFSLSLMKMGRMQEAQGVLSAVLGIAELFGV